MGEEAPEKDDDVSWLSFRGNGNAAGWLTFNRASQYLDDTHILEGYATLCTNVPKNSLWPDAVGQRLNDT